MNVNVADLYCPTCGKNLITGKSYGGIMKEFIDSIYDFVIRQNDLARALDIPIWMIKEWVSGKGKGEFKGKTLPTIIWSVDHYASVSPAFIKVGDALKFFDGTQYERAFRMKILEILQGKYSVL